MNKITFLKIIFPLGLLLIFGTVLRFYNLDWGDPFYFHPDERNIASSISQLVFPTQLNPNFFAYGSLPIYLIFIVGLIVNMFHAPQISFQLSIIISRSFSAILSLLLIPSIFYIVKFITNKNYFGIFAAALITFSTGFIQFAHFGTFEMWLTFFGLWLFYFCAAILKNGKTFDVFSAAICSGILLATKVSSVILIPLPIICLVYFYLKQKHVSAKALSQTFLFCFLVGILYIFTNPFVFLDTTSFLGSMHYESQVATGTLPVFYTGEFYSAIPIVFQFLHVFPFLLNPFITIVSLFSIPYFFFITIKRKKILYLLLCIFFLLQFFSQAILFVKWTRYMMPVLPLMYLVVVISAFDIYKKGHIHKLFLLFCSCFLIVVSGLYATLFTYITYVQEDTRLAAVDFAKTVIPSSATITSEVYDLGIVPFNSSYPNIVLFNFYDLDNNGAVTNSQLRQALQGSDYLVLPSQRILKPRFINSKMFPNGNMFYTNLLNGSLGFTKIYETPCDIFCKIVYLNDPVFALEETATVFDRPTVYIFKKER